DYQTKQTNPDQQVITYVVAPGDRYKVVNVDIHGNKYFKGDAIRERMFIQPAGFLRLRHGRYSDGFAKRDQEAIRALYRDNGFRDVKVDIRTVNSFEGKPGNVGVVVSVEEGPQYKIAGLTVDGITRRDKDTITALLAS